MSESTLSLTYSDLLAEVGGFLGYGRDSDSWSDAETDEIDRYVQAGIRQFYYPPAAEGIDISHEWSFLNPFTTLVTVEDVATVDLPDDLGRVLGSFYYDESVYQSPIPVISEAQLMALRSRTTDTGAPQYAAVRYKSSDGSDGQHMEVIFWPTPDIVYTLTYKYEAFNGKLSEDNPYPLGGMRYAELITESCLAVAEQRANDEKGIHWDQFVRLLAAGVAMNRKQGVHCYGDMGDSGPTVAPSRLRSGEITYKNETW